MYEVINPNTDSKTVDRTPVLGYRLIYAPKRSDEIMLEQKDFSAPSSYHSTEIQPHKIFTGENIKDSLSTKGCAFAYGHRACVASAHIAKDASSELKANLIKHLEDSILAQITKYIIEPCTLTLSFPDNNEYL
jgi:hypothetical protein